MDLSLLEDITDDVDFCMKLAREENLVLLPGQHHNSRHLRF